MKFNYTAHRDCWITVEIDARDEHEAQEAFEQMEFDGELNDRFRDEVLEAVTEVAEVWQDDRCIYSIY